MIPPASGDWIHLVPSWDAVCSTALRRKECSIQRDCQDLNSQRLSVKSCQIRAGKCIDFSHDPVKTRGYAQQRHKTGYVSTALLIASPMGTIRIIYIYITKEYTYINVKVFMYQLFGNWLIFLESKLLLMKSACCFKNCFALLGFLQTSENKTRGSTISWLDHAEGCLWGLARKRN